MIGPFPIQDFVGVRDHFAVCALGGLCAQNAYTLPSDYAKAAYEIADAMMDARAKDAEVRQDKTVPDRFAIKLERTARSFGIWK